MKYLSLLLSVLLLISLAGCNGVNISEAEITDFSTWLDREGFVPSMSQSDLKNKMKGYIYEGKSVADSVRGDYYDGGFGGGFTGTNKNFYYGNDFAISGDKKTADYTNSFSTKVPLDNLVMPFSIEFGDTLLDVMHKLGVGTDPSSNLSIALGLTYATTLYKDNRYSLVFNYSKNTANPSAPYELVFSENYVFPCSADKTSNVTRTITFTFSSEGKTLYQFSVKVHETYDYL